MQSLPKSRPHGFADSRSEMHLAVLLESPPFRVNNNISHYESTEYSRLVQVGRLASEDNQRLAIYHDLTRRLKDEAFFLPVANPLTPHGLRREVQDLAFTVGLPAAVQFANVSVGWTRSCPPKRESRIASLLLRRLMTAIPVLGFATMTAGSMIEAGTWRMSHVPL